MLKGSGITKSNKRKWSETSGMESKPLQLNQGFASPSVLNAGNEVHFVINSDFKVSSLTEKKPIELPCKTYSKKTPFLIHSYSSDPLEPFRDSLSAKERLPSSLSLKCSPVTTDRKTPLKKLKKEPDSLNGSRRVQKRKLVQSCNAKVPKQPRSKSLGTTQIDLEESSDSEIEIVGVYKKSSGGTSSRPSMPIKLTNGQLISKKSGKNFESKANGPEVVINEADIAPVMPINPTASSEVASRVSSMKWSSTNGEISVSSHTVSCMGNGVSSTKSSCKLPISLPEVKSENTKKKQGKREMKSLFDNLNEISWAQKNSFKKLLLNPDASNSRGRDGKFRKNLRRLKPIEKQEQVNTKRAAKVKASQLFARKKSRMARLNLKNKVVQRKAPIVENVIKEKKFVSSEEQVLNRIKACNKKASTAAPKSNSLAKDSKIEPDEETEILYSLPNPMEIKDIKPKTKLTAQTSSSKVKNNGLKVKTQSQKVSAIKPKSEAQKTKNNYFKLKPDAMKQKSNMLKLKPDGLQKEKSHLLKLKPDKPVGKSYFIKAEDSPPSTSGSQEISLNSKSTSNSKNSNKSSNAKNFLKNVDSFDFSRQVLKSFLNGNENVYSNVRKASELRVLLQPLEHTNLWTSEFYDDFRRHFLDQALRRALENHDRESIGVMYQELLDNYVNIQPVDNVVSNNTNGNKSTKKKRMGEEETVRSSLRQSEGAFRYKDIVVKKHPNYIQVILVPNDAKQNSLSVEALKELKEAFLLAKKDPNCNAVLLNSGGKYFCTGLDLSPLVSSNKKQAAEELSSAVRDLVLTLGMFTKPLVAAVNGVTIGFGVSILTYCDIVLASDKATFCLPAAKLGYIPEGGVTLTLPQVVGSNVASEMLLRGRRLTAEQALRHGLVSEVLWPSKLMNEVIPRLQTIIAQPLTAMETTKAMVRYHLWDKLKSHMERERRLIVEHWVGTSCQNNIKALLQTGWLDD